MSRQNLLLGALAAVGVIVLFWFLLWRPAANEIAEIEAQVDQAETQIATLDAQIAALEDVRARAPEIEAALAASESVLPRDAALASALRQLQLAADDSGTELVSVAAGRPVAFSEAIPELASISLSVQVDGGYYQLVDFLRRLEDPAITPRGFAWLTGDVALQEYPTLGMSLSGNIFAILPAPPVVVEPDAPAPAPSPGASPSPSPNPTVTTTEVQS